jgi:hypothetical protein
VRPHAADTHSGMVELAFAQGLQCMVVDLSVIASIAMFISIPLSLGEIRAECGATVATTEVTANTNAKNMRGQAIRYYKKTINLSQLYRRTTVSQIEVFRPGAWLDGPPMTAKQP